MPFYMPWFTVSFAVLSVVGILSSNIAFCLVPSLALLSYSIVFVPRLFKLLLFLSLVPITAFVYAHCRIPPHLSNSLNKYSAVVLIAKVRSSCKISYRPQSLNIDIVELIFPSHKICHENAQLKIVDSEHKVINYRPGDLLQIKGKLISRQFSCIYAYSNNLRIIDKDTESNFLFAEISIFVDKIRKQVSQIHIKFLGNTAGSLLSSMILGDKAVNLDRKLLTAFRKVGLSHLVAASGFNLTIVTLMTYYFLRFLRLTKKLVIFITCINVLIYSLLAGFSASINRAALACVLLLLAKYYGRHMHSLAALSLVLVINLIIDPNAIISPGGQLSYAAVTGILLGAESLAKTISFGKTNRLVKILSTTLSVILVAQLFVLPIQLYHFCQIGLLFLPANILVDPFVAPVTIIGFTASLVQMLNWPGFTIGLWLCQFLDLLAFFPLQIIVYITEKLASYDSAIINTAQPYVVAIIFYYCTLSIFLISLKQEHRVALCFIFFLCGLLALFYRSI